MWISKDFGGKIGWGLDVAKIAGSFVAGGIVVVVTVYYFLDAAIPDIKDDLKRITGELQALRSELRNAEDRQRSDLSSHIGKEEGARERIGASLRVLQTHVIALKQEVEKRTLKPSEMQEILATIRDVSTAEGAYFGAPSTVAGSAIPQIPRRITAANLKGLLQLDIPLDRGTLHAYKAQSFGVDQYLALMLLAKNATWQVTETGLKVNYDGGSAVFPAKRNVTQDDLKRQADLFNSLARAVSETIGKEDIKPGSQVMKPSPKAPPDVPGIAPVPHSLPVPERRAPELPVR